MLYIDLVCIILDSRLLVLCEDGVHDTTVELQWIAQCQ